MNKILNKLFYILKNIMLPIVLCATIYIIIFMFRRLEKDIFGASFLEFAKIVFPFILLLILIIVNSFSNIKIAKDNLFYNLVSFLVMLTIMIFCCRALFDQNMFMWHKYGYNINFGYFADQVAPIKVMLYCLSITNILLIVKSKINIDEKNSKSVLKSE